MKQPNDYSVLGNYILPVNAVHPGEATRWRTTTLVVLHLELNANIRPSADPLSQCSPTRSPVTTAIMLIGKKEELDPRVGTFELLLAAGMSQPSCR